MQNFNESNMHKMHKNYDKFTWLGVIFFPDETGLCNITRITVELWTGKKHNIKVILIGGTNVKATFLHILMTQVSRLTWI